MGMAEPRLPLALIIENDENIRDLAVLLFEETEFAVVTCESAEAALDVMEKIGDRVAILFVDVRLQGQLGGVDLARIVASRWPQADIVLTSGMPSELLGPLPVGAVFMPKPWRALDVLIAAERAHAA